MGATLFTLFGVLALLIAAVGLYSAISYGVTQRRHEFGVRMALGARVDDIVGLVLGQGVRAAVAGVVIGLGVALAAGGMVADLLFQTSPRNPLVFGAVGVVIVLVAVAATFVPAWRASRVDPVAALRAEYGSPDQRGQNNCSDPFDPAYHCSSAGAELAAGERAGERRRRRMLRRQIVGLLIPLLGHGRMAHLLVHHTE
jgi:hypothetical protein